MNKIGVRLPVDAIVGSRNPTQNNRPPSRQSSFPPQTFPPSCLPAIYIHRRDFPSFRRRSQRKRFWHKESIYALDTLKVSKAHRLARVLLRHLCARPASRAGHLRRA